MCSRRKSLVGVFGSPVRGYICTWCPKWSLRMPHEVSRRCCPLNYPRSSLLRLVCLSAPQAASTPGKSRKSHSSRVYAWALFGWAQLAQPSCRVVISRQLQDFSIAAAGVIIDSECWRDMDFTRHSMSPQLLLDLSRTRMSLITLAMRWSDMLQNNELL